MVGALSSFLGFLAGSRRPKSGILAAMRWRSSPNRTSTEPPPPPPPPALRLLLLMSAPPVDDAAGGAGAETAVTADDSLTVVRSNPGRKKKN